MTKYVALLRGINVSGQKLIKMEDLRKHFAAMGFDNVSTYIQSGNIIFESGKDEATVQSIIAKYIHKTYSFEVEVFIRTDKEMAAIVKNNPFEVGVGGKNEVLYVSFLNKAPDAEQKKKLLAMQSEVETYATKKREVYCLVDKDAAKVPFSNTNLEKLLKMPATTRNWNTTNKILTLME